MAIDLILKGGRIIDPSQDLDAVADIGFGAGRVAAIGPNLAADVATEVVDVSGLIVTPGLVDLHTHVYWGGTSLGIDAEEFCRTSGVTTCIDTGSAGPGNFAGFLRKIGGGTERNGLGSAAKTGVRQDPGFSGGRGAGRRVVGRERPPMAPEMTVCTSCHGSYPQIAAKTASARPNPHASHLGEIPCTACHHVHRASQSFCDQCHTFGMNPP